MKHYLIILTYILLHRAAIASKTSRQLSPESVNATLKETEDRILNKTSGKIAPEPCGKIYTQPQFIIESPNYPGNYPPNLECNYVLKGPSCETNYEFQFLDFFLEKSLGCANDRLEIQNLDALCGSRQGTKVYPVKNGVLDLKLITDGENSGRGFRILVSRNICVPRSYQVPDEEEEDDSQQRGVDHLPPNGPPIIPTSTVPSLIPRTPCYDHNHGDEPGYHYGPSQFPVHPGSFAPSPSFPYFPHFIPPVIPLIPVHPTPYYPHLPATVPTTNNYLCCASTYNEKRFYLASPGFPYSNNHPTDCVFNIFRSNDKICRLRINFYFFWVGDEENGGGQCSNGFLEIDGKLICGCRTGMKLISPFDGRFGNRKVLRFRNLGVPRSIFSGFAVEIVQDECPKRYSPSDNVDGTTMSSFTYYNDQNNRVAWPSVNLTKEEDVLKRATKVAENTEIIDVNKTAKPIKARLIKSIYFFDYDDVDNTEKHNKPRDVEETMYVDTQDITTTTLDRWNDDNRKCRNWGVLQWTLLTKDVLWKRMQKCNSVQDNNTGGGVQSQCKEFHFVKGFFQTPRYPFNYPDNMNLCYRFVKQPGICKLKLIFLDFQLENSYDCKKDYLQYGNYRYCGNKLLNTVSYFDVSHKPHEQFQVVTDGEFTGRGFKGIYEQIPCSYYHHHHHQTPPVFTTPAPYPPSGVPASCSRDIGDQAFTLGIYDYGHQLCNFLIRKSTPNICRIQLEFTTFELVCSEEYLLINKKRYCGRLSGQTILLEFPLDEISLVYNSRRRTRTGSLKLHIAGSQISENCFNNEDDDEDDELPPAQRIIKLSPKNSNEISDGAQIEIKNMTDINVILKKQYKEICGVLMNIQKAKYKDAICEILLNNRKNIECTPLTNNTIYVPYNKSEKLELHFNDVEEVMNIDFMEISCNSKQVLI